MSACTAHRGTRSHKARSSSASRLTAGPCGFFDWIRYGDRPERYAEWRYFVVLSGLASYGTSLVDGFRQAGVYTGRVLKGAKTADLPAVQTTSFEFVINLTTAKALGIEIAPMLSARADEVIE